ncbi:MAG: hypothetical protein L0Y43_05475 [Methylococcaceae bacterium]|nr:hypothetical protein [Methylococcaceae bacterium]
MPAGHKSPKRKVRIQVFACGHSGSGLEPVFDLAEGLKADEAFMVAGAQAHLPVRRLDIPGIDAAREQIGHPLIADIAVAITRELQVRFQEALHFGLELKPSRGIAFERLLDDGGERFIPHQDVPLTRYALVAIADRRLEHPVAVLNAGAHPVLGLLAVLLALMLRHAGQQVLNEHGIRVFAEFDRRGFQDRPGLADRGAKLQMRLQAPRQTRDVIDDDDMGFAFVLAQIAKHCLHPGAIDKAARHIVLEDLRDLVALVARIFAAARFL